MPEKDPWKIALAVALSIAATVIGIYNLEQYFQTVRNVVEDIQQPGN